MLVLSRNSGEKIVATIPAGTPAGTQIVFDIVEIRGDKVRVGVTAPVEIRIDRGEKLAENAGRTDRPLHARGVHPRPLRPLRGPPVVAADAACAEGGGDGQ